MKKNNIKLIGLGLLTIAVLSSVGWYMQYDRTFSYTTQVSSEELEKAKSPCERKWEKYLKQIKLSSDISVFIQDDDDKYVWNNHRVRASSMIRPFIMASVFENVKEGNLDLNQTIIMRAKDKVGGAGRLTGYPSGTALTLRQLVTVMIASNDNTATNLLIDLVGMDNINKYIADNGYKGTVLQRKMMDNEAVQLGNENYTTAKDLGDLFMRLEEGKCVNPNYDREMLYILMQQESREILDSALPEKRIAHTVGEWPGLLYDGGIIFDENLENPYVMVILNDNYKNRSDALELNWQIAHNLNEITEEYQTK